MYYSIIQGQSMRNLLIQPEKAQNKAASGQRKYAVLPYDTWALGCWYFVYTMTIIARATAIIAVIITYDTT